MCSAETPMVLGQSPTSEQRGNRLFTRRSWENVVAALQDRDEWQRIPAVQRRATTQRAGLRQRLRLGVDGVLASTSWIVSHSEGVTASPVLSRKIQTDLIGRAKRCKLDCTAGALCRVFCPHPAGLARAFRNLEARRKVRVSPLEFRRCPRLRR